jgi:hypothetical protein
MAKDFIAEVMHAKGANARAAAWCRYDGLASTVKRGTATLHSAAFKARLDALRAWGGQPEHAYPGAEVALRALLAAAK